MRESREYPGPMHCFPLAFQVRWVHIFADSAETHHIMSLIPKMKTMQILGENILWLLQKIR